MWFGYTRVSTVAQTLDHQNQSLDAGVVSNIFSAQATVRGKDNTRILLIKAERATSS
jgi:hypothetical protein